MTFTTSPVQNVAASNGATGFFFLNGWDAHPSAGLQYVTSGWTVVGQSGWIVTAVDKDLESITITGGTFLSGASYQFVGEKLGLTLGGGMTMIGVVNISSI